ncbi:MAG: xanthine dehydrogenase family protein subunit M [Chloroflexi bacterium]|nr:xanthine dehydrogenase family protein subunit M [Chloroflexota bacterium]
MINVHAGLPEFEYVKPGTMAEASRFLVDHVGEARLFTGGTDTFVRMRDGFWKEKYLVDVKHLQGMRTIRFDPEKGLTLGAAVNMNEVIASAEVNAHYPLLAEAAQTVASYQLRNRATIAGNICNASPAGDTLGACLVYNASLYVHGVDGLRDELLRTFFCGPGKTVLHVGDIVTELNFPIPPQGARGKYIKLGRNVISDLAIVGITVLGFPDADVPSGFRYRIALASVAPTPLVVEAAGGLLEEKAASAETIEAAAQLVMEACSPIDDVRGSARYRKLMVRNLTRRALTQVASDLAASGEAH